MRAWTTTLLCVLGGGLLLAGCPAEPPVDDGGSWPDLDDDDAADDDGSDDDASDDDADDDSSPTDEDGDGWTVEDGDCDDHNSAVNPDAEEVVDGVDNDCDGFVDEGTDTFDDDGDGWSEADGDCDDNNPWISPEAEETVNGIDDDCDGIIDNDTEIYDDDGDGFSEDQGDCDDTDPFVFPGMMEMPNGIDDDCDGTIDEGTIFYDDDGDGWSELLGDCDDNDPNVHPYAPEDGGNGSFQGNGIDDNCNGIIDDGTTGYDDDGDGFSEDGGDCDDFNPLNFPGNYEDPWDGMDNDCDGTIDEPTECDCPSTNSYGTALDACSGLQSESIYGNAQQYLINNAYGSAIAPHFGCQLLILHTGAMWENPAEIGLWVSGTSVTEWDFTGAASCGAPTPPQNDTKFDLTYLNMTMLVPANTYSFSVDFFFATTEYPEWVCTAYNDTFEIYLESSALNPADYPDHDGDGIPEGNVAFDGVGLPITVNNDFFVVTNCATMYNIPGFGFDCGGPTGNSNDAGATGWLTTTAPVNPGETITLKLSLWDEGDGVWDSVVFIDNFQWHTTPVTDPQTQ